MADIGWLMSDVRHYCPANSVNPFNTMASGRPGARTLFDAAFAVAPVIGL